MPASKRDTPKNSIEEEIYKNFEFFKPEKSIKISDFLNKLDISRISQRRYRKIKFSYVSLVKLILFMKLKGFRFQNQLYTYLKLHREEKAKLGFKQVPDRRTINYFINHILDENTKTLIDFAVKEIISISTKFSIDLDIELTVESPKKPFSKSGINKKKKKETKKLARFLKKKISPFLEMKLGQNCIYKKNDFIDLLVHMASEEDFAEDGSKTLGIRDPKRPVPNADTLLYHLKKYDNPQELQKVFIFAYERIWEMVRKKNVFSPRKKYDLAVDFHDWLFYGDRGAPMVVGTKPRNGTDKCYRFATITIVEHGKRFTLLSLPAGSFDKKENILSKLLEHAKKRVRIRKVTVDRGFYTVKCIQTFNKHNVKYLMPCKSSSTIEEILEKSSPPCIIKNVPFGNILIETIVVERESKRYAFTSNEQWNENDVNLTDYVFKQYSKRWGIETLFRIGKHTFRPKTTSKNYLIRLFYFLFSFLMYNLWILINILLYIILYGKNLAKYAITSKLFATTFLKVDYG